MNVLASCDEDFVGWQAIAVVALALAPLILLVAVFLVQALRDR